MKALRTARLLTSSSPLLPLLSRFNSTSPLSLSDSDDPSTSASSATDFVSRDYRLPISNQNPIKEPTWDQAYRDKADRVLLDRRNAQVKQQQQEEEEIEEEDEDEDEEVERNRKLARVLLEAALLPPDEVEDGEDDRKKAVKVEDQRSLSVGIIGAPNAGKSSLTNFMSFFDTPGLMIGKSGLPFRPDVKFRVENAWSTIDLYDLLIVIFDVHRHLTKRDSRVIKLIKHLGGKVQPKQKRLLCMNKVDLVENKKDLLKVAQEFEDLPGFERYFMVSGLKGSGVKDLHQCLMDQAIQRPWDEDPTIMSEEVMKNIALEVVREKMLDHIHQEIPYVIDHRLMDWKELRDGSLRMEQHFITPKQSQHQILVGKNCSKIGRIGIEANEELRSIFKREVHLILQVRVSRKKNA